MATPTVFLTGSKSSIGTTGVQLTSNGQEAKRGVLVKADADNAGKVYIGNSGVTTGTDATNGFQLSATEQVVVPIRKANQIFVIASQSGQKVYFVLI